MATVVRGAARVRTTTNAPNHDPCTVIACGDVVVPVGEVGAFQRRRVRLELSAAEPLPAVMRMRDGYFSARGSDSAPFGVWLWPSNPEEDEIHLGVTTGTWEATSIAARRINAWLGVEIDFDEDQAHCSSRRTDHSRGDVEPLGRVSLLE